MKKKKVRKPALIGVVQLPALGGAPGARDLLPADALQRAGRAAVSEARALEKAGFTGILLENHGDAPFYDRAVPPETIAALAIIAAAVRESVRTSIGIRVLRSDPFAALAIAATTGCDFIHVGTPSENSTLAKLVRERDRLGANVAIFTDDEDAGGPAIAAGSEFRRGGKDGAPLDPARLRAFMKARK